MDGLSEERKLQLQRDVSQQVTKQLALKQLEDANLALYLSSIYDQSIYENISKVVQKLVPSLAILENLLDVLISNCRMNKAFLFDVITKVYLATDSQPVPAAPTRRMRTVLVRRVRVLTVFVETKRRWTCSRSSWRRTCSTSLSTSHAYTGRRRRVRRGQRMRARLTTAQVCVCAMRCACCVLVDVGVSAAIGG